MLGSYYCNNAYSHKDELYLAGMWLELPVEDANSACLEPLYYRVVLSLFSLLTRFVESGASEPNGGEGWKDGENSSGLANAAKDLLRTVLTVSAISISVKGQAHCFIYTHTHTLILT